MGPLELGVRENGRYVSWIGERGWEEGGNEGGSETVCSSQVDRDCLDRRESMANV